MKPSADNAAFNAHQPAAAPKCRSKIVASVAASDTDDSNDPCARAARPRTLTPCAANASNVFDKAPPRAAAADATTNCAPQFASTGTRPIATAAADANLPDGRPWSGANAEAVTAMPIHSKNPAPAASGNAAVAAAIAAGEQPTNNAARPEPSMYACRAPICLKAGWPTKTPVGNGEPRHAPASVANASAATDMPGSYASPQFDAAPTWASVLKTLVKASGKATGMYRRLRGDVHARFNKENAERGVANAASVEDGMPGASPAAAEPNILLTGGPRAAPTTTAPRPPGALPGNRMLAP
mmetsp:Transcript_27208/g.81367  ORF Transcript_27208/g.81367 Transcript_27208/m.81367 type:complete len:298 (+) Transcript_27208:211-1104(+)